MLYGIKETNDYYLLNLVMTFGFNVLNVKVSDTSKS